MAKEVPSGTSFHLHKELSRRFSMQDEAEQKATILIHFYPEVTVEKMSSYRKKQKMLSHRNRKCGILCLCKKECVLQIGIREGK